MKALIISVGTGTGPEAQHSLAHGLIYSISNQNPDKLFLIVTKESAEQTVPLVLSQTDVEHELICIDDPDDINAIYERLSSKFKEVEADFDHVAVDYTSGTKAMTGALIILASLSEANSLTYVTGKRESGVVIKGTEKLLTISPYPIIFDKKYSQAVSFFNSYQFGACLQVINHLVGVTAVPSLLSRLASLRKAAEAYSAWDRFDHQQAHQQLRGLDLPSFKRNAAFLGALVNSQEKEPYYIVDLVNNAMRREREDKYDDAVARLYRLIELIGQYRLKGHGIDDTSDVPRDRIPAAFRDEFRHKTGRVLIGLDMDYKFLAAFGDGLGSTLDSPKVKDALRKRNESILAHGLSPVGAGAYRDLLVAAEDLARMTVRSYNTMVSQAAFAPWTA